MRRTALLVLPLALLTACSGGSGEVADDPVVSAPPASPAAMEGLQLLEGDPGREHRQGPIDYGAVPPLGGPHNPRWLACDVYDEPVPAEFAVHSLEHGAVWLTYRPGLAKDQVEALTELAAANREYVLVSPQDGLASDVVAAAWGRKLEVDSADDDRLAEFVAAFAGGDQGGEPGVPCRTQGVTPREAAGMLGPQAG